MAVATSRTRIGCMVTSNTYRHPAVLAKAAVTVDHLSSGRLEFGLGAGWAENEHAMLGLPFGTKGDRADWLEEACQVIRSLWTEQRTSFGGSTYQLNDDLLALAESYRAVRITEIVLVLRSQDPADQAALIADLLPRLRAIS